MERRGDAEMVSTRGGDSATVKPTRVFTTPAVTAMVLPLVVSIVVLIAGMWKLQGEEQRESRLQYTFMTNAFNELKAEVKFMNGKISERAERDAKQDQQILDLDRRITRMEAR